MQTKAEESITQTLFESRGYPKGIFRLTPIVRGLYIPTIRDQPLFNGHEKLDEATPGPSAISDQPWTDDIDDFNYVSSMKQYEMNAIKTKQFELYRGWRCLTQINSNSFFFHGHFRN